MTYPKRLIEVDLPIRRISAHARREKSIRHGHISTLHIWWARRPLAACRAVICAALWPDPADPLCPQSFRDEAARLINAFAAKANQDMKLLGTSSEESNVRWLKLAKSGNAIDPSEASHLGELRGALLDFIADFSNWDNSTVQDYLDTSRALTQAAHEALGGAPGTRPLVVDPFAGGGSIPLEALRVGADAFASDLNPVAVLLNKVVLEYIPKYGQRLADEVRKWGAWIKQEAEKELGEFYPKDPDGATPVAFIWARNVKCEGPGCGVEYPLIRSMWIANKPKKKIAFTFDSTKKDADVRIVHDVTTSAVEKGTTSRGSATCPCCGFTTPSDRIKVQLGVRKGGVRDARLLAVITSAAGESGVSYRLPTAHDLKVVDEVSERLMALPILGGVSAIPDEPYPDPSAAGALSSSVLYGAKTWGDIFSSRQSLSLATFSRLVSCIPDKIDEDRELGVACATCLAFCVSKLADYLSSLCIWRTARSCAAHTFGRQALPMAWDFAEMNPFAGSAGDWSKAVRYLCLFIEANTSEVVCEGTATRVSAKDAYLPDDSADFLFTDPPYYDAIAYGDLSDFFYVWLKRCLGTTIPEWFQSTLVDKTDEIVHLSKRFRGSYAHKTKEYFEKEMTAALTRARGVLHREGIGSVVFAHKSTTGWEAMLGSLVEAGWTVTGSWPVDTERGGRLNSNDTAALASSVHIVCRPRETASGEARTDIGDWRNVLAELPPRIHEWMPRLASEGIVGADAIFACLGPALEIFSRYSRVEKASGEVVTLREYLELVWAAVSTEALSMIFKDADAAGLEPDARLTAMWLWTLGGGANGNGSAKDDKQEDEGDEEEAAGNGKAAGGGFMLEYDAARKIAQGLGVHLEQITSVVEIKGDKARLRGVAERTKHLFGKDEAAPTGKRRKKKSPQKTLFEDLEEVEATEGGWSEMQGPPLGVTVLDRVHQAMILFAAGRSEALKRFLVEDGAGTDARFWKLAQSLSALYPKGSDEKRWVDGVLARKKGWGF